MTHFGTYFLTYFLTYKSLVIWLFHFWKVFKPSLLFHKFIKNIQYTIRRMYCTAGFPSHPNNLFWRFWMRAMFARTHQHHSFFTVTCDTSFLGKTTLLYTFMTSKLILEHSWLLRTEHAQYVPQGHGCNFHDRDFGFSANLIICAQLTYFAVSNALRVRVCSSVCARAHIIFFFTVTCVTHYFCVKQPLWTCSWLQN